MTTEPEPIGIGELSRRTGLTQQTIRAWEARFGFPVPQRTSGGHRAYATGDVDAVRRVLALKSSGVRLAVAVDRVRDENGAGDLSVYGMLRRRHPHLEPRRLRRPTLVALSHAIEDEAMSLSGSHHVFGAFQRERFYDAAAHRWREIARTAASCLVFADFPRAREGRDTRSGPLRVPLPADAPLLREWAVVVVGPALAVALTAWEPPRQPEQPPAARELEAMLTLDPLAVRTAAEVCLASARASGVIDPASVDRIRESLTPETAAGTTDSLLTRIVSYLET